MFPTHDMNPIAIRRHFEEAERRHAADLQRARSGVAAHGTLAGSALGLFLLLLIA